MKENENHNFIFKQTLVQQTNKYEVSSHIVEGTKNQNCRVTFLFCRREFLKF